MRVVKNIHNNISLCLDSKGNEVIAFGKGIGFKKPPYDIPISKIERTFYHVNPIFINTLSQIPENIIEISTEIIDYANHKLSGVYNENLIFTLADHILFSIKRKKENITINLPFSQEVRYIYPKEIKIGEYAINLIKEKLGVELPQQEAAIITLHIVEYGLSSTQNSHEDNQTIIDHCTEIVESFMDIKIDRQGFSYSRFVSHMYYLFDRLSNDQTVNSQNKNMFEKLVHEYPQAYRCSQKISEKLGINLNNEELMYLIIHINRLSSREENN